METNAEKQSRQATIIQGINNGSDESLILMLEEFRESGESFIVPALIEQLFANRSQKFMHEAIEFLADLKEQSCVPMIVEGIKAHITDSNVSNLVSICWQCRLNFSKEIPFFFELISNADYQTAFEAFSVIENSAEDLSEEELSNWIDYTNKAINNANEERTGLLNEVLHVLNDFKIK